MISVIIAALNSADTICHTLSSIFLSKFPRDLYEVIVVDNGSIDNTVEMARRFPAKVYTCLRKGQAPARNLGMMKAEGDIICFTDSDVIFGDDWLSKILDFFEEHPEADGVGGPVFPPVSGHRNLIQKWFGEIYFEDQHFPTEITKPQICLYRGAFYSANCAFRRDALLSVDGFDDSLWDGNDIDLCWRLLRKGKNLVFNPDIAVVHMGFPCTIRSVFEKQFKWGRINTSLIRIHTKSPDGADRVGETLRMVFLSSYNMVGSGLALLCSAVTWEKKQLLKHCLHLSFHLGQLFELLRPATLR